MDNNMLDLYHLFYEMMMCSLKTDDVKQGLNKSLYMLRLYLNSGNVAIYRKNKNGIYVFKNSDSNMGELVQSVGYVINKAKPLIEQKNILNFELNISDELQNMMSIYSNIDSNSSNDFIIVILNNEKTKEIENQFWNELKDTLNVILKRAITYEKNVNAMTMDLLTGLDNRNAYEMRINELNENDSNLIVGIFDLFRLKYINDNYTHDKGDLYIKEVAKILNKYWPKQIVYTKDDGTEEIIETGHSLYRIGGDEFLLLTTKEKLPVTCLKANLAKDESAMINLNVGCDLPIGINYGIVKHNPCDSYKQTFIRADEIMKEDKTNIYKKYKLDRRH